MRTLENETLDLIGIRDWLTQQLALNTHPQASSLIEIVTGDTNISSAGFPYISDRSFRIFVEEVPHLFEHGTAVLKWLDTLEEVLPNLPDVSYGAAESLKRAIQVLQTVIFTAGVTAVSDLWLLRQVLSTHKTLGIVDWLLHGHTLDPVLYAQENNLDLKQLRTDLRFLYTRGYLRRGDGNYLIPQNPSIANVLKSVTPITTNHRINIVSQFIAWFSQAQPNPELEPFLRSWLQINSIDHSTDSWIATYFQIELGYRLLPLILSLRVLEITNRLEENASLKEHIPNLLPGIVTVFERAGFVDGGLITKLGARVFARGPGPFGIIAAYYPYMNHLDALLKSEQVTAKVQRAENVAASQDANRKTFKAANEQLDSFCQKYGFQYTIFVEHAVGQGEATRQRFLSDGEAQIQYFGADLEDAAIDQAIIQQSLGFLPRNMQFIRQADIGEPERVIHYLAQQNLSANAKVMMVGNGFHEIREQTNDKMIAVFAAYQKAGFVLIFTEESALHDAALIQTAWNTYHAGFRYVHEVSGQGLRPAIEREGDTEGWSWRKCARLGGYVVLDEFSYRTRSIYPYKRPEGKNPSISVTYFCVPQNIAEQLGLDAV